MSCCDQNHENSNNNGGKPRKHMPHWLHMILCCGIPVVLLLLLPYIGRLIPGSGGFLASVIPFICPLMMGFMLLNMFRSKKNN